MGYTTLENLPQTIKKLHKGFLSLKDRTKYKTIPRVGTVRRLFIDHDPKSNLWHPYFVVIYENGLSISEKDILRYADILNEAWDNIKYKLKISARKPLIRPIRLNYDELDSLLNTMNRPTVFHEAYLTTDISYNVKVIDTLYKSTFHIDTIEFTGVFRELHNTLKEMPIEEGGLLKPKNLFENYDPDRTGFVPYKGGIFVEFTEQEPESTLPVPEPIPTSAQTLNTDTTNMTIEQAFDLPLEDKITLQREIIKRIVHGKTLPNDMKILSFIYHRTEIERQRAEIYRTA